jgi:hypothetical protein
VNILTMAGTQSVIALTLLSSFSTKVFANCLPQRSGLLLILFLPWKIKI